MSDNIRQMPTFLPVLIPSTAKRKQLWSTVEKQPCLLLQKPHGDLWGDGMWLQLGAQPGQEDNKVMVCAGLNKQLSWCDWCSLAPPSNLFYRHCTVATEGQGGLQMGFPTAPDWQELEGEDTDQT